jgi:hypothetical protein
MVLLSELPKNWKSLKKSLFLLERDGETPSVRTLAKEAKVSWRFANKVINEVLAHGNVLESRKREKTAKHLPGSRLLDFNDELVLLSLREQHPQRALASCKTNLQQITGAVVSMTTISIYYGLYPSSCLDKIIYGWKILLHGHHQWNRHSKLQQLDVFQFDRRQGCHCHSGWLSHRIFEFGNQHWRACRGILQDGKLDYHLIRQGN